MKAGLNLNQVNVQTLTMTPQLQQAIRLLQLSTIELQHEIQENLDKNPFLEMDESDNDNSNIASLDEIREHIDWKTVMMILPRSITIQQFHWIMLPMLKEAGTMSILL